MHAQKIGNQRGGLSAAYGTLSGLEVAFDDSLSESPASRNATRATVCSGQHICYTFDTRILPDIEDTMGESENRCERNAKPRQVCYGRGNFHELTERFGALDPLFEFGLIEIQRLAWVDDLDGALLRTHHKITVRTSVDVFDVRLFVFVVGKKNAVQVRAFVTGRAERRVYIGLVEGDGEIIFLLFFFFAGCDLDGGRRLLFCGR